MKIKYSFLIYLFTFIITQSLFAENKIKEQSVINSLIPDSLGNSTWGLDITKKGLEWKVSIGPMLKPGKKTLVDTLRIILKKSEYLTQNNCRWEKHGDNSLIIAAKKEFQKPFKAWFIDTEKKKIIPINAKEVKCWAIEGT